MRHQDQVIALLKTQIRNEQEVHDINVTAQDVVEKCVNPVTGGKEETNGLVYGLVQSGKTGVLTVTGAKAADEGYRTVVILTSDNDALYDQTLARVQQAFPGIDILSKSDFKDASSFLERVKVGTCAIVTTKNASLLKTLIQNFKKGNVHGLSCLIIDDEADQASLNTRARKQDGTLSRINEKISDLRAFFEKNTYLQVTATPQALFLQPPRHAFRPKFTVLSHPGADYVGGDDFFGETSELVREFPIMDITALSAAGPAPRREIPSSLVRALDTFMVGATFKRMREPDQNCAFLCHVSTRKADHDHIVELLRKYKSDLAARLKRRDAKTVERLKCAYDDLAATSEGVKAASFEKIVQAIEFFSPGITIKLVNGETDEDVAVRSPYNLFVGGNKLGRGVTISNLLVSYYGRNPKAPQADTVLQHARMYGYRRKDIGLLRLFLPRQLHSVFKAINKMERALRELIAKSPGEGFRGLYVEGGLKPTRRNVLAPGAVGIYTGGSNYNPAQIVRGKTIVGRTERIDRLLRDVGNGKYIEVPIKKMQELVELTTPDPDKAELIWDAPAIIGSLQKYADLKGEKTGYVYVDRDRGLEADRSQTAGILTGGEVNKVPGDKVAIFMLRTKTGAGRNSAWWPQVRFPSGRYAFAFAV